MSTQATISSLNKDKTVSSVNVRWAGYIEYTGIILDSYYHTNEIVAELINLGDINILKEKLIPDEDGHSVYTPQANVTIAYFRDYTEIDESEIVYPTKIFDSFKTFIKNYTAKDFNYFWQNHEWYVMIGDCKNLILLETLLKNPAILEDDN